MLQKIMAHASTDLLNRRNKDVAKKVHKNIPTLYGKSSKTKENYTFLNEGKDEILDY